MITVTPSDNKSSAFLEVEKSLESAIASFLDEHPPRAVEVI